MNEAQEYLCHSCHHHKRGTPATFSTTGRPTCHFCSEKLEKHRKKPSVKRAQYKQAQKRYREGDFEWLTKKVA